MFATQQSTTPIAQQDWARVMTLELRAMSNNDNDMMDAKAKECCQCKAKKEQVRLEAEQKRQEEEQRHEVERAAEVARMEADCMERQQVVEEITTEVLRKRVWAESSLMSSVKAR